MLRMYIIINILLIILSSLFAYIFWLLYYNTWTWFWRVN